MTKRATRRNQFTAHRDSSRDLRIVHSNKEAMNDGPTKKKTFHLHDMYRFDPLTQNQSRCFQLFDGTPDKGLIFEGCPGTGKTFLAVYLALRQLLDPDTDFRKIVIIRSTVPVRDMGFLPGTEEEKFAPYEQPYIAMFDEIFKFKKSYENMKDAGMLEFESTSFLRGRTFHDSIVILDEAQNTSHAELQTIVTRMGKNSKMVLCGDSYQSDFTKPQEKEGNAAVMRVLRKMNSVDSVRFEPEDIVRSGWVKEFIMTQIKMGLYLT